MKMLALRSLRVSIPIPNAAEASGHERPILLDFSCRMSADEACAHRASKTAQRLVTITDLV
jgi:hypothetical protein